MNRVLPPAPSGLPFNAQLHQSDLERGYVVPNHYPQPLLADLVSELEHNPDLRAVKEAHEEFIGVLKRATVQVVAPLDQAMLDRIHATIEYVIKEGPVSEAIIIAREINNPDYRFLYDHKSYEHVYYRWKLFSILNGEDPYEWRTEEFRMFEDGPLWKPPPLNPFADGMPDELISCLDNPLDDKNISFGSIEHYPTKNDNNKLGGTGLNSMKRAMLDGLLQNLEPTRAKIGASMMFCIDHADAAREIIDCIQESLQLLETPPSKEMARLFLISDILNNCSAAVTNASFYREGFQAKLGTIFECLQRYLANIVDRCEADKFKHKILAVLGAWKEWTLYENGYLVKLSNILLGIESASSLSSTLLCDKVSLLSEIQLPDDDDDADDDYQAKNDAHLDGIEVDEETLSKCLESKGLSLRWYMTLELSDDEQEQDDTEGGLFAGGARCATGADQSSSSSSERVKFKSSKWETLDPNEVAGQVVTISKWETMAKAEEDGVTDSPSSSSSSPAGNAEKNTDRDEEESGVTDDRQSSPSCSKKMKIDSSTAS